MHRYRGETFPNYGRLLDQSEQWPSESSGLMVPISSMNPRYALSAYQKLLRWARSPYAYEETQLLNIADRLAKVGNSPLARSLADRAEGLPPDSSPAPPVEVTPRELILVFAPIVAEHTDFDIHKVFSLCEKLAIRADELWTITVPPG